jgi:transposase
VRARIVRGVRRAGVFRVVSGGLALVMWTLMAGLPGLCAPWFFLGRWPGHKYPEVHRWHDGQWGTLFAILLGANLVGLWQRPAQRPLLAQYVALAGAALALVNAPFNPLIELGLLAGVLTPVLVVAWLYPRRAALVSLQPAGRPNWPLALVSIGCAVALAPVAWHYLNWQWDDVGGEHAKFQHWTITTTLLLAFLLAGLLAATRRPGARWLGVTGGIAFIYLGLAALRVPDHPGSWGTTGGWLALLAGLGYIATTLAWEWRYPPRLPR